MSGAVVVVGAGVAGSAAALAAARGGARVVVLDGGAGASTLWTGAVDSAAGDLAEGSRAVAEALGVRLEPSLLVTTSFHARLAHGRDASLLDLHPLLDARARVGVVRVARPGWDADEIVRAGGQGFVAVGASLLRHADEGSLADAELAARHDDDGRLGWLGERLREALARAGAEVGGLLLPPSLGVERARAAELSSRVGVACGEALGLPGGPAGLRFEHARDRAFAAAGIAMRRGRVRGVSAAGPSAGGAGARWRLDVDGEGLDAGAVVLAAGGLIGGGLEYQPSEAMEASALPPRSRPAYRCTVEGPWSLAARGRPLDAPGSLFGVPPEDLCWPLAADPLADRVGVATSEGRVVAEPARGAAAPARFAPALYAAGDVVADARRSWLEALDAGVRAGHAAARDVVTGASVRPSPAEASATRP